MRKNQGLERILAGLLATACILGIGGCEPRQQATEQAEAVTGGNPEHGRALVVQYGCKACHAINDVEGPSGAVGPPLIDIKSRSYIAGVLTNTPAHVEQWIMHPTEIKPGTAMPDLGVTEEQAKDIVAFLYSQ